MRAPFSDPGGTPALGHLQRLRTAFRLNDDVGSLVYDFRG